LRNAVFISAGIGNALLLIPLIKALREHGSVTAINTSPFGANEVFNGFDDELFDDEISLTGTMDWMKQTALKRPGFHRIYVDHFAATRKHLIFASTLAKEVITNTIPPRLPQLFRKKIRYVEPIAGIHEGAQYLRFIDQPPLEHTLQEESFLVHATKNAPPIDGPYITLQPGSGNNIAPWKTWPLERWIEVMQGMLDYYPSLRLVVLGDASEREITEHLPRDARLINMIDKTRISELPSILSQARMHLGNDSGLMHLAGCLGVPTISVWGGSDPAHYGWNNIDKKHAVIYKALECGPCNRWIQPNTSKAILPSLCPDFACLHQITSNEVLKAIVQRLEID
jgi:ADP-heptose:LPS heptosyltransferase